MDQSITRGELMQLRQPTWNERNFFPRQPLRRLLSRARIKTTLAGKLGVPSHRLDETVQLIFTNGVHVLAILILMDRMKEVLRFMESRDYDAKLPLASTAFVERDPSAEKEFLDWQWEFIAPVFSLDQLHLRLPKRCIIPFFENREIAGAKGGYGQVFEATLDTGHQKLVTACDEQVVRIARKQLADTGVQSESMVETEVRALEILGHLSHPNILEFYCSYTIDGVHNLLFPLADMNIQQWMQLERKESPLSIASNVVVELRGLASALDSLHNFIYKSVEADLEMIGYHHDLKPANILIKNNKFLIADFGLSRIKSKEQLSSTRWKGGTETYGAPECADYETLKRLRIGRGADIWSFGCILCEIAVYMHQGPSGVSAFAERRMTIHTKPFRFEEDSFHENGLLKPKIQSWLEELLAEIPDPEVRGFLDLARSFLDVNTETRPDSSSCLLGITFLAAKAKFRHVASSFRSVTCGMTEALTFAPVENKEALVRLQVEKDQFETLGWALGFLEIEGVKRVEIGLIGMLFARLCRCMKDLSGELEQLGHIYRVSQSSDQVYGPEIQRHVDRISIVNDDIQSYLPKKDREIMDANWNHKSTISNDPNELELIGTTLQTKSKYQAISRNAMTKSISLLITQSRRNGEPSLLIERELVELDLPLRPTNTAAYCSDDPNMTQNVLIEWKQYRPDWIGPQCEELFGRVEGLARLLVSLGKDRARGILDCMGYIHQAHDHRLGFVYSFPDGVAQRHFPPMQPTSLAKVIHDNTANIRQPRPLLGDIFELANSVANTLFHVHEVSWLHKNISSSNVVFFAVNEDLKLPPLIKTPWIIGFSHSRPDDDKTFTQPPPERNFYQHPDYALHKTRFMRLHDYYSLGIVLLEIGLWSTISSIGNRYRDLAAWDFNRKLLKDFVPQLGEHVGASYRDAVYFCLGGETGTASTKLNSPEEMAISFHRQVLDKLASLHA